jgi:hypothetical protein
VSRPWDRAAAIALWLLAAGMVVGGMGHTVASWNTAVDERGGADDRFRLMASIGWVLVAGGVIVALLAWRVWAGSLHATAQAFAIFLAGYLAILGGPGTPLLIVDVAALALLELARRKARASLGSAQGPVATG